MFQIQHLLNYQLALVPGNGCDFGEASMAAAVDLIRVYDVTGAAIVGSHDKRATSARLRIVFVEFGPGMHTVPVQFWCVNAFVSISIALGYAPRNGSNTVL